MKIPTQPVQVETRSKVLLQEAVPFSPVEFVGETLAVWRQHAAQKPTLLLLGNEPMLARIPDSAWDEASHVIAVGSYEEVARAVNSQTASPLLLPVMTLEAALRSGWLGRLAWALPFSDLDQTISSLTLSEQLLELGLIDDDEAASLTGTEKVLRGEIRGVPLIAAALPHLPELTGPVIVHIDQSYFRNIYKNEIVTPLVTLVIKTLEGLRDRQVQALAVTFSYGNLDERIALDVRFIGEIIETFVQNPENFDQPVPANWKHQSNILYLANFFKKEETRELALAMNIEEPDSAWAKFSMYRSASEHKQGSEALNFLAEAVRLDKVYAMEYLGLSEMAYDKGRPGEAMRMLSLAATVFPDNVKIKLNMARLATDMGEKETALHLLAQLQQLEWSTAYYPDMPQYLKDFTAFLKGETVDSPNTVTNPINDPRRQRILK